MQQLNLELVNLTLPKSGFRDFISSWIFEHNQKLFVVDLGPKNSLHHLTKALNGRKPDYILLTHIHIDHAGGVGELHSFYPEAKIVCFSKAKKHLVNPKKLIQGSKSLAGDLMQIYGEITAVSEESIITHDEFNFEGLEIIETPGHASHHISYLVNDTLFCGEALGVILKTQEGLYIRPAVPPPFKIDIYINSIKKLKALSANTEIKKLCFGHFGSTEVKEKKKDTKDIFELALEQIKLWYYVIQSSPKNAFEKLLEKDENFSLFTSLPKDIQEREKIFIANSIAGIKSIS